MTEEIRFSLQGPPVAWHRPKLSRSNRIDGRGVRVIKHPDDVAFQTALALEATSALMRWAHEHGKKWDGTGEWHLDCEFHVHDLIKRDCDNICKNVMDALSGIVYDDDKQVVQVTMMKVLNRARPKVTVTVRRVRGFLTDHSP